jgi:hypothetical protein
VLSLARDELGGVLRPVREAQIVIDNNVCEVSLQPPSPLVNLVQRLNGAVYRGGHMVDRIGVGIRSRTTLNEGSGMTAFVGRSQELPAIRAVLDRAVECGGCHVMWCEAKPESASHVFYAKSWMSRIALLVGDSTLATGKRWPRLLGQRHTQRSESVCDLWPRLREKTRGSSGT